MHTLCDNPQTYAALCVQATMKATAMFLALAMLLATVSARTLQSETLLDDLAGFVEQAVRPSPAFVVLASDEHAVQSLSYFDPATFFHP